jgi:hypothetical protein
MTKAEVISSIMYDLRFSTDVSFEVDERISASVCKVDTGYCIYGVGGGLGANDGDEPITIFCSSAAEVRKAIASLGKTIVQM